MGNLLKKIMWRDWSFALECMLFLVILGSVLRALDLLYHIGYLPPPFFHDTDDTFLDWYNAAYWSHNQGAYTIYRTIYPPMSFDFMRLFSQRSCYIQDSLLGRHCDHLGLIVVILSYITAVVFVYFSLRRKDRRTALVRTSSIALGLPMLFALERGQLVIVAFLLFVLGYGGVLRSARMRWTAIGAAINFKPYLIVTLSSFLVRRKWRWLEGVGLAGLIIYLISFALFGDGSPLEIIKNTKDFTDLRQATLFDFSTYSTTYDDLVLLMNSNFPIMFFLGSRPMEAMEFWFPLLKLVGEIGVMGCLVLVMVRKHSVPVQRLIALSTAAILTASNAGGYAALFLIFLVFQEKWGGIFRGTAIVACYALSVIAEFSIVKVAHQIQPSWLTNRLVGIDLSVSVGEIVRPGLVMIIEFALIGATLIDLLPARAALTAAPGSRLALPEDGGRHAESLRGISIFRRVFEVSRKFRPWMVFKLSVRHN